MIRKKIGTLKIKMFVIGASASLLFVSIACANIIENNNIIEKNRTQKTNTNDSCVINNEIIQKFDAVEKDSFLIFNNSVNEVIQYQETKNESQSFKITINILEENNNNLCNSLPKNLSISKWLSKILEKVTQHPSSPVKIVLWFIGFICITAARVLRIYAATAQDPDIFLDLANKLENWGYFFLWWSTQAPFLGYYQDLT